MRRYRWPPPIVAREYKVPVRCEHVRRLDSAVRVCERALVAAAAQAGLATRGSLEERHRRTLVFLDTTGFDLFRSGVVLRQREGADGRIELTLKAMSPDPFV